LGEIFTGIKHVPHPGFPYASDCLALPIRKVKTRGG
jgi:hypothetical protein